MFTNENNPTVSVVMPVYGAEMTVAETVYSVLGQCFDDFELLIVNDGAKDSSIAVCEGFEDPRVRMIHQANRGLSGARNTGIREARGKFIALIDADDTWHPHKLRNHVIHLEASPHVGISYSGSAMVDELSGTIGVSQKPRLTDIRPEHVFLRNPIGNGSAPVFRREVFEEIAYPDPVHGESAYFDETFRQSEDIECWTRISLTTDWKMEGLPGQLTNYRINANGLSADVEKQLANWERMVSKVAETSPQFHRRWAKVARGFQLRYLARRAVQSGKGAQGLALCMKALREAPHLFIREPFKTTTTFGAAMFFAFAPRSFVEIIRRRFLGGSL